MGYIYNIDIIIHTLTIYNMALDGFVGLVVRENKRIGVDIVNCKCYNYPIQTFCRRKGKNG